MCKILCKSTTFLGKNVRNYKKMRIFAFAKSIITFGVDWI